MTYIYILNKDEDAMNKIILFFSILFFTNVSAIAQNSINDYKYIIIPTSFDFLKEQDQYQLNSLTEFLFNKYGYTAFMQNEELPEDLRNNRCLGLYADVKKIKRSLLKTKIQIDLKDCQDNIIQSSRIGETRIKEFDKAYNVALRDAFVTYQMMNYNYQPNDQVLAQASVSEKSNASVVEDVEQSKAEIERLQKEIEALKEAKEEKETPQLTAVIESPPQVIIKKDDEVTPAPETKEILYAQPIAHGFQLVDKSPKVVMILLETTKANTYIVKGEDAIVYKEDGFWYISRNDGNTITIDALTIKF